MILIFDSIGGLSDQKKNITSAINFCNENNFKFTFRNATCRPINDPTVYRLYNFNEFFDPNTFSIYKNYVIYDTIKNNINHDNTYDFFKEKIVGKCFRNEYKDYLKDIKNNIKNILLDCKKEYVIIGGSFWSYYGYVYDENIIHNIIQPSSKIVKKYNEIMNKLNCKEYNFIHYRYEEDWSNLLNRQNKIYKRPLLDTLIENIKFKRDLPIYVCTSCIEKLHDNKWMLKPLTEYSTILYKNENDMVDFNYDECGYVDYLIGKNAEELYGFSYSGFSQNLNKLKGTKNYYDLLDLPFM